MGSLYTAVASYVDAKAHAGEWLVRIEDLDQPRTIPGADQLILQTLEAFALEWDGVVLYQSQRQTAYSGALSELQQQQRLYSCDCTRKQLAHLPSIDGEVVYPGQCRHKPAHLLHPPTALRIQVPDHCFAFNDGIQGYYAQKLGQQVGDFVVRRKDQLFAYQLAVVVDDAEQGISHIVRGSDLLSSTPRQMFLQQCLGYPSIHYNHLPILTNQSGDKLSKQTLAPAVTLTEKTTVALQILRLLGQNPATELTDASLPEIWQWAITHWQPSHINRSDKHPIPCPDEQRTH